MSKAGWIAVAIAGVLFGAGASPIPGEARQSPSPADREELRAVLLQARDAVIQVAANDTSSLDTSISERVQQLVDSLLFIQDRENVRYLQRHLKKAYADEIIHALEPIVSIKDEDAIVNASRLSSSYDRMDALGQIAITQYGSGSKSAAQHTVDLAIQAALEPDDPSRIYNTSPREKLLRLAGLLHDNGCPDEANKVLLQTKKLLDSSSESDWAWRDLADNAIGLENLAVARQALENIGDEEGRSDVEQRIQAASTADLSPDAAIRTAIALTDFELRIRTLCAIARRQISGGDLRGANTTVKLALDAANQEDDDTFQVFRLNDIAWVQIDAGDNDGAEQTLEVALKANEKHRWGTDQVNGWVVLADTFAFLGHFERARDIANKSDDHFFRGLGLRWVSYREAVAGQRGEVLGWVRSLKDPDERSSALLGIAQAMIEELKNRSDK